jgi:predicted nucleotidyltransferase
MILDKRILATLRFFDLQELPLTQFEIYKYLLANPDTIAEAVDTHFELNAEPLPAGTKASLEQVLAAVAELKHDNEIEEQNGYYSLPGRLNLVDIRLSNYAYGIRRERKIRRYLALARFLPFIRGIALAGSQALGQQRPRSDIDLFIITDPRFMWTARTFLTAYFQILGMRRHGKKIANRFCLNHYLAGVRPVDAERNLYKAMEYLKLRSVVYQEAIVAFQKANQDWIRVFFPNADFTDGPKSAPSSLQMGLEKVFIALGGRIIETRLGAWQLRRIRQDKFIFVREDELSFHPGSKHEALLGDFFKLQKD